MDGVKSPDHDPKRSPAPPPPLGLREMASVGLAGFLASIALDLAIREAAIPSDLLLLSRLLHGTAVVAVVLLVAFGVFRRWQTRMTSYNDLVSTKLRLEIARRSQEVLNQSMAAAGYADMLSHNTANLVAVAMPYLEMAGDPATPEKRRMIYIKGAQDALREVEKLITLVRVELGADDIRKDAHAAHIAKPGARDVRARLSREDEAAWISGQRKYAPWTRRE